MNHDGRGRLFLEVAGFAMLVLSLVFVGYQIQQNTTAVRSATQQAIADQATEIDLAMATNPELSGLIARMAAGETGSEFSAGDDWQLSSLMRAALRRVENIFLQVQNGVIDEQAFRRIGFGFYAQPFGRALWEKSKAGFDPRFVAFMDGKMEAAEVRLPPQ